MTSGYVQTVQGLVSTAELGLILPHEHLFTDLRGPHDDDYAIADPEAVGRVLRSYLDEAHEAGVTALVECSTVGVGRNLAVLRYLAEITPIHIIAPTEFIDTHTFPSLCLNLASMNSPEAGSRK